MCKIVHVLKFLDGHFFLGGWVGYFYRVICIITEIPEIWSFKLDWQIVYVL